jgi:hypothetical protein
MTGDETTDSNDEADDTALCEACLPKYVEMYHIGRQRDDIAVYDEYVCPECGELGSVERPHNSSIANRDGVSTPRLADIAEAAMRPRGREREGC